MKKLASLSMAPGPIWALRACAAIALTVASFAALRNRYHGWCIIPNWPGYGSSDLTDFLLFLIFPTLFLIGFIWAFSELVYPWLLLKGMRRPDARWLSIALGLAIYTAVGFAAWWLEPLPYDDRTTGVRAFISVFWSVGVLFETGNFSQLSCGY